MYSIVHKFCQTCADCQAKKSLPSPVKAPLVPIKTEGRPFQVWIIDFLGPLPVDRETGNKHILVCIDAFSRFAECFCTLDQGADTVAKCLVNGIFCRYGCPQQIHSDRGASFMSDLVFLFNASGFFFLMTIGQNITFRIQEAQNICYQS